MAGKNWFIYHLIRKELRRLAEDQFGGRLLDVGCGNKPYEDLLAPFVEEHVGIDLEAGDAHAQACELSFHDGSFDCVLLSSVLEHVAVPLSVLEECHRVLRPSARLISITPFLWHEHPHPIDLCRWTEQGLRHLFTDAEFTVLDVRPLTGFWGTFGQLLAYRLHPPWTHIAQALAYILNKPDKWTCAYILVARREPH